MTHALVRSGEADTLLILLRFKGERTHEIKPLTSLREFIATLAHREQPQGVRMTPRI